jgi:hypothetical protein
MSLESIRAAVVFSIQSWLGESEESKKNSTTPGYFSVGMSSTFTPSKRDTQALLLASAVLNEELTLTWLQSCPSLLPTSPCSSLLPGLGPLPALRPPLPFLWHNYDDLF